MFKISGLAAALTVAAIYGYSFVGTPSTEAPVPVAVAVTAAPTAETTAPSARPVSSPEVGASRLRELVQQSTGTICETSGGVCEVSPRPINSPCQCGNYVGRVVR